MKFESLTRFRLLRAAVLPSLLALTSACASREPSLAPAVHTPRSVEPVRTTATGIAGRVESRDIDEAAAAVFGESFGEDLSRDLSREVERYVDLFSGEAAVRERYGLWLNRMRDYEALIESELEQNDLPRDLIYLALIESGFNPNAVSRAGAVGIWQFMAPTARELGLRIDEFVDERRDPVASTRAAARYLAYLRAHLGSWPLALAAYNGGMGRVGRAVEETGSRDVMRLAAARAIPEETATYVPKVLAAAVIGRDPSRYGFYPAVEAGKPYRYETLEVAPWTRLDAVARAAGLSSDAVRDLNPHLVKGFAVDEVPVRVPGPIVRSDIVAKLEAMDPRERYAPRPDSRPADYVVQKGDSWWKIAQDHDIELADLRALNPDIGDRIYPGMTVVIRTPVLVYGGEVVVDGEEDATNAVSDVPAPSDEAYDLPSFQLPAVRDSGDSLKLDLDVATTTGTNQSVSLDARPDESVCTCPAVDPDTLTTPARARNRGPTIHTVQPGETMIGLARSYGITVRQLMSFNDISEQRYLYVGERLRVAPEESTHTVAKGENLTAIAKRYGVSVQDLVRWNDIRNPNVVFVGKRLHVTAPSQGS